MIFKSSAEMLQELRAKQATAGTESKPVIVNRLRDLKEGVRDMPTIDPRILVIDDGHNPRNYDLPENRAHLDELKKSIRENTVNGKFGTLVPLLVRYDPVRKSAVVVDGECRLRANLELIAEGMEIAAVPCIQVTGDTEADRLLVSITANTGKPLSKWELGGAFQRFTNLGWTEEKISARTGYSESFISGAMELANAPDEIKQMLSARAVTPSLALDELRANGAAAVQTLQAMASERKASGKKGPVGKPPVRASKAAPAPPSPGFISILRELIDDTAVVDLNDESKERVSVDRLLLLKLASFAVTEEEVRAAMAA